MKQYILRMFGRSQKPQGESRTEHIPSYGIELPDDNPGVFWEGQRSFAVKAPLHILYTDAQGDTSKRDVDVQGYSAEHGVGYVAGICHLRQTYRTFRVDRIRKCFNTQTMEPIEDVYNYLWGMYERSPYYAADLFREAEHDAMRLLFYVGKAEGHLLAPEKTIIYDTCRLLAGATKLTEDQIGLLFEEFPNPSKRAFEAAVDRCRDKPSEVRAALIYSAERMIATQKTVYPVEKFALLYMRAALA